MTLQPTKEKPLESTVGILFATTLGIAIAALGAVYGIWHTRTIYAQMAILQEKKAATTALMLDAQNALYAYLAFGRPIDLERLQSCETKIQELRQSQDGPQLKEAFDFYDRWHSQFATPLLKERAQVDAGHAGHQELEALFTKSNPEEWGRQLQALAPPILAGIDSVVLSKTDAELQKHQWDTGFTVITFSILGFVSALATAVNLVRLRQRIKPPPQNPIHRPLS